MEGDALKSTLSSSELQRLMGKEMALWCHPLQSYWKTSVSLLKTVFFFLSFFYLVVFFCVIGDFNLKSLNLMADDWTECEQGKMLKLSMVAVHLKKKYRPIVSVAVAHDRERDDFVWFRLTDPEFLSCGQYKTTLLRRLINIGIKICIFWTWRS